MLTVAFVTKKNLSNKGVVVLVDETLEFNAQLESADQELRRQRDLQPHWHVIMNDSPYLNPLSQLNTRLLTWRKTAQSALWTWAAATAADK